MEPYRNSPKLWRNLLPPLQELTATTVATPAAVTTVNPQFYVPAFCIFHNLMHYFINNRLTQLVTGIIRYDIY
jgi:hypothetical protein